MNCCRPPVFVHEQIYIVRCFHKVGGVEAEDSPNPCITVVGVRHVRLVVAHEM